MKSKLFFSLCLISILLVCQSCTTISQPPVAVVSRLVQNGSYLKAVALADKQIKKTDDPVLRYYRACANFSLADYSNALDDFIAISNDFQNNPFFHLNKGHAFLMQGHFEHARKSYERVVILVNKTEGVSYEPSLALVLPPQDRVFTIAYYSQITGFQQYLAYLDYVTGISFELEGEKDKFAMKHYSLAVDMDKDFLPALYHRSRLYLAHGAYAVALDDLNRIAEHVESSEFLTVRAEVYKGLKKWGQALDDYSAALVLDKDDPALYEARASIYDALNQPDQAALDRYQAQMMKSMK